MVVAILHLEAEAPLQRVIRRVREKTLRKRPGKVYPHGELKWASSSPEVREAVLRELVHESGLIAGVSAGVIFKTPDGPWGPELYRLSVMEAFAAGRLIGSEKRARLTVDGGPRFLRSFFSWLTPETFPNITDLRARNSEGVPELQAVDFIAGAIASAFVHEEDRYLRILEYGPIPVLVKHP